MVDRLSQPEAGSQQLRFKSEHAQNLLGQYCVLLRKGTVSYWRNPGYNAVRFTFTVVYGVLMGAAFWSLGSNRCVCILTICTCMMWHQVSSKEACSRLAVISFNTMQRGSHSQSSVEQLWAQPSKHLALRDTSSLYIW